MSNTPSGPSKITPDPTAPAGAAGVPGRPLRMLRRIGIQNLALVGALVVLSLIIRAFSDKVFLISNVLDIGVAVSILGILAVAQMVVIISGGLDISIGSTASLSGVVVALLLHAGVPTFPAIVLALAVGVLCGAINGFLITAFSISPIIVTLATFSAFSGVALLLTHGIAVAVANSFFDTIGTDGFLGVPYPVILLLVFAVLTHLYLRYSVVGRHVYAIGSNENAARNTGISLARYRMGIYIFAGFAGGVAGVLGVARDALGQASGAGADEGLTAITAALLGGAALTGGRGSIPGAVLGVIILGLLDNGLVLVGADPFYSQIFVGALLVTAVRFQKFDLRRFRSRRSREAGK